MRKHSWPGVPITNTLTASRLEEAELNSADQADQVNTLAASPQCSIWAFFANSNTVKVLRSVGAVATSVIIVARKHPVPLSARTRKSSTFLAMQML
jgi:hypothetical protein